MRLLTDQDVYAATVLLLRGLGHDVITAAEKGMSRSEDADLLRAAQPEGRVFVTRDRDYGGLVFAQSLGTGVLYLRVLPSTLAAVHAELGRGKQKRGRAEKGTDEQKRGRSEFFGFINK